MKSLTKRLNPIAVFITGLILLIAEGVTGQEVVDESIIGFKLKSYVIQDSIVLRIAPVNFSSLIHAQQHGYRLIRSKIPKSSNDTLIYPRDTIFLIGHSVDYWDTAFSKSDNYALAAGAMYGELFEQDTSNNADIAKVYERSSEKMNRFSFGLYAAELELPLAKDLGLLYVDRNMDTNFTYEYRTVPIVNSTDEELKYNQYFEDTDPVEVQSFDAPLKPYAIGGDRRVRVFWDKSLSTTKYESYEIERSDDGGLTYKDVTSKPLLHIAERESRYPNNIVFIDSVGFNEKLYVYRIAGYTPLGKLSGWSDTVHVYTVDPPLKFEPSIDSVALLPNNNYSLHWSFESTQLTNITGFNIYWADERYGAFKKLNEQQLGRNTFSYTDTRGKSTNYYYVEAIDTNGYSLKSIVKFVQAKDSIPPSKPKGLNGYVQKDGTVVIFWRKNTEEDMSGYRVYLGTSEAKNDFYLISNTTLKDTICNYKISMDVERKFVNIFVRSEDYHQNYSQNSDTLQLSIPDIFPPDNPIISSVEKHYSGIKFKYIPSSSKDVSIHVLQRRVLGTIDWETLRTPIVQDAHLQGQPTNPMDSFAFIDTTMLKKVDYEYRIAAYDIASNKSVSKVFYANALLTGIRNVDLTLSIDKNTIKGGLVVTFPYTQDITEVHSFLVMRSINGAPFVEIKTIFPDDPLVIIPGTYNGGGQLTGNLPLPPGVYGFIDYLGERKDPVRYYSYKVKVRYLDSDETPPSTSATIDLLR